jgi:hypothetical protein
MKDPCDKCLVSVMCSQICWDKANYDTLLKNAINHAKQMINKKTYISYYVDDFLKYNKKYNEHKETLSTIKFRKESLKNEYKK